MADPAPVVPTPNPAVKPGASTSEYYLTKVIVLVATAVGILGAALDTANTFAGWIPADSWGFKLLAIGGGVVAFLKATVYTLSRAKVKIAAMETGTVPDLTPEQAAEILDGSGPLAAPP